MIARLTVHLPFQPTRSFRIEGAAVTVIGRDPECNVVLDDDRVSRKHARLLVENGTWRIIDLDSTNGIAIGGRAVTAEAALESDGWISFGGLLVRFEQASEEAESAAIRRREERYRTSISLQRELKPSLGLEPLLERVLDAMIRLSSTQRGAVLLRREDGSMDVVALRDLVDADIRSRSFSGSVGAIQRAADGGRTVAVSDALLDVHLKDRESVIAGGIRALVCVPLVALDRPVGLVYADSREPGTTFSELDVEILEALASHAALAIVMARVDRELHGLAGRLPDVAIAEATSWSSVLAHHEAQLGERW